MKISKQQRVMHIAHILYQNNSHSPYATSWRQSVTDAWGIQAVRDAMLKGIVRLYFFKTNGEETIRHGTLSPDHIPGSKMPKGTQERLIENGAAQPVWASIAFYDLDKKEWRSFKVENLRKAMPVADMSTHNYMLINHRLY